MYLNFGPQVQAPSTPRNKYYSSFRKELTRLDLRTRLARSLKLRAPRSHPHFPFLVFSPRSLFLPHLHRCGLAALTLHTGEHRRGSNSQRSPEIRGRPHTPWAAGAAPRPSPMSTRAKQPQRPPPAPLHLTGLVGSDPHPGLLLGLVLV